VSHPELMQLGRVLAALRAELAAHGVATAGLTITRLEGTLALAGARRRGTAVAGWPGLQDGSAVTAVRCMRCTGPAIGRGEPSARSFQLSGGQLPAGQRVAWPS
jgi:hypothetical protein